jgi:hypothetical protein
MWRRRALGRSAPRISLAYLSHDEIITSSIICPGTISSTKLTVFKLVLDLSFPHFPRSHRLIVVFRLRAFRLLRDGWCSWGVFSLLLRGPNDMLLVTHSPRVKLKIVSHKQILQQISAGTSHKLKGIGSFRIWFWSVHEDKRHKGFLGSCWGKRLPSREPICTPKTVIFQTC